MLNKEKLVDAALEIAYTNPAHTILIKTYNKNGNKDVYASDYFIREAGNIITPDIWKVKMEIISDVVEGKWKMTGSQSFETSTITPQETPRSLVVG